MTFRRGADTRRAMFAAARRRKPGEMNKTEAAFAAYLEAEKAAGRICWWQFEGLKLRLADRTYLTMDFNLLREDGGILELIDTKASSFVVTEDFRVKVKVAASMYPFRFFIAIPQRGIGWQFTEI